MQKVVNNRDNTLNKLFLMKLIRERINFLQEKENTDHYIMQKLAEGVNYEELSESMQLSKSYILSVCKKYDYKKYCGILSDIHRKRFIKKKKNF